MVRAAGMWAVALGLGLVVADNASANPDRPRPLPDRFERRQSDQDAARNAMLQGDIMPFSLLKRRVEQQIGNDAEYLGSEFLPQRNAYRLKYMRDRNVLWVDVDGRTGDITGWAR